MNKNTLDKWNAVFHSRESAGTGRSRQVTVIGASFPNKREAQQYIRDCPDEELFLRSREELLNDMNYLVN